MLKSLELENFKAFGRRTKIPFAPITLIFGENSSGKSSILQALNLLKQTIEGRDPTALLLPRTESGTVDLGSFQDAIFDHDLHRSLKFRLRFSPDRPAFHPRRRLLEMLEATTMALEFSFNRPTIEEEVQLETISLYRTDFDEHIATFSIDNETTSRLHELPRTVRTRGYRIPHALSRIARCKWITKSEGFWDPFFQSALKNRRTILKLIERIRKEVRDTGQNLELDLLSEDTPSKAARDEQTSVLSRLATMFSKDFDIKEYIDMSITLEKRASVALESFLPIASEMAGIREDPLSFFVSRMGPGEPFLPGVVSLATYAGRMLEDVLIRMFPLGPFRRPPERWYIFSGTSPKDVGYRGDQLPDLLYRDPELLENANEWLARLDIGYRIRIEALGERNKDLFELRLEDTRRKGTGAVEVGLSDVGFGISQLLPFLVQALASRRRTISIEQPEVHIHPRLQADLGDLLADCIQERRENQFIIETHSEHLVLRIQRLVRAKKIKPEDVSILYVMRGDEGSRVISLPLDEDGDFIEDWPGGFFPERLRELE